jgi:hypothetical protein
MINVLELFVRFQTALRTRNEQGFTTAELLGNAALAVVALVVIWGLMRQLGVDVVDYMRAQILSGG